MRTGGAHLPVTQFRNPGLSATRLSMVFHRSILLGFPSTYARQRTHVVLIFKGKLFQMSMAQKCQHLVRLSPIVGSNRFSCCGRSLGAGHLSQRSRFSAGRADVIPLRLWQRTTAKSFVAGFSKLDQIVSYFCRFSDSFVAVAWKNSDQ